MPSFAQSLEDGIRLAVGDLAERHLEALPELRSKPLGPLGVDRIGDHDALVGGLADTCQAIGTRRMSFILNERRCRRRKRAALSSTIAAKRGSRGAPGGIPSR